MVLKIGLVGCGAIGMEIARAMNDVEAELVAVFDRNGERAVDMVKGLKAKPELLELEDLVERSDIVVEAASQRAVPEVARAALERGRDPDDHVRRRPPGGTATQHGGGSRKEHGCRVYLPSGAISGLDGLRIPWAGRIHSVALWERGGLHRRDRALSDDPEPRDHLRACQGDGDLGTKPINVRERL